MREISGPSLPSLRRCMVLWGLVCLSSYTILASFLPLSPAGCLHFDYIRDASIAEGLLQKQTPRERQRLPLALLTESPRRVLLGNLAYLTREEGRSSVAKARREEGSTTNTMMRSATTSVTAMMAFSAAPGAKSSPGNPKRKLSTQTTMVAHKLHAFIIHNPTATTRPTT